MMFEAGDVLVPRETPFGPREARMAWADELGQLLVVTGVLDGGKVLRVNSPATGETVQRSAHDIGLSFEDAGTSIEPAWGAFLMRAGTEAARVDRSEFADDGAYWSAVARAVTRVEVEMIDEDRGAALDAQPAPALSDPGEQQLGPFVAGSRTSRRAAIEAYPKQGSQRWRIIEAMRARHASAAAERGGVAWDVAKFEQRAGVTRDELAEFLRMSPNTVRPRVVELIEGGWVRESEQTRKTDSGRDAAVLVMTERAVSEGDSA